MGTKKVELLSVPPDIFTFKVNEKNRRMKLYIKLNQQETENWNSIKETAKPSNIGDNEFARFIFFRGLDAMMQDLVEKINSLSEEEKQKIIEADGPEAIASLEAVGAGETIPETSTEDTTKE